MSDNFDGTGVLTPLSHMLPPGPAPPGLWDLYGKSKGSESGGYVNWGAHIGRLLTTIRRVMLLSHPAGRAVCMPLACCRQAAPVRW